MIDRRRCPGPRAEQEHMVLSKKKKKHKKELIKTSFVPVLYRQRRTPTEALPCVCLLRFIREGFDAAHFLTYE